MTIEELIIYGKKYLHSIEAKMLLSSITGYDTLNLLNHLDEIVEEEKIDLYKKLIDARLNNKPVQYIVGTTEFYGLELFVNENVLIPRFETEELVENTLKIIDEKFNPNVKVLDLCCGSGAIGLAIKNKLPNAEVSMSDISIKALEVANKNKENLNLNVEVIESDLFNNINKKYDVIISNPPYIAINEEIDQLVKDNEPHLALYGGEKGLDYYELILKNIKEYLNDKFLIAFEIGQNQKKDIISIINQNLTNVEIITKKDLSDKDRMIFIIGEKEI